MITANTTTPPTTPPAIGPVFDCFAGGMEVGICVLVDDVNVGALFEVVVVDEEVAVIDIAVVSFSSTPS